MPTPRVALHIDPGSPRSRRIADAMLAGCRAAGASASLVQGFETPGLPDMADVVIAYGWGRPALFEAYLAAGRHYVYVDLGWWDRKPLGRPLDGFHKVVVDAREPVAYFRGGFPDDRLRQFGVPIMSWRETGSHILLAGMSEKSAGTRGYRPQAWEAGAVARIRAVSTRPIFYRPKPSWTGASPIPGTIFTLARGVDIGIALKDAWAIVTYHSNVAVDALAAGIPVCVDHGVAAQFSTPVADIERPFMPIGRRDLLSDIAYCQWSTEEMARGDCWRHLLAHTPLKVLA